MLKNSTIPLLLSLLACATASAEVTLPKLISDGMVLQRNTELKIWGWAAASEIVRVQFLDSTYSTAADNRGDWAVLLSPQEAGGPYQMIIDAGNSITISEDVLKAFPVYYHEAQLFKDSALIQAIENLSRAQYRHGRRYRFGRVERYSPVE